MDGNLWRTLLLFVLRFLNRNTFLVTPLWLLRKGLIPPTCGQVYFGEDRRFHTYIYFNNFPLWKNNSFLKFSLSLITSVLGRMYHCLILWRGMLENGIGTKSVKYSTPWMWTEYVSWKFLINRWWRNMFGCLQHMVILQYVLLTSGHLDCINCWGINLQLPLLLSR